MAPNTIKLHRVFTASPEKIFKAFMDPDAMASWLPPYGFICKVHQMDFKVGGKFKMTFINFSTGNGHSFGGAVLRLCPGAGGQLHRDGARCGAGTGHGPEHGS